MPKYLNASEVVERLGISKTTLYSYVSRGLLTSHPTQTRERLYLESEVNRLLDAKTFKKNPTAVAQQALNWGDPVLDTHLSFVQDGVLHYRNQSATALSRSHSFEQVAQFLWTGQFEDIPDVLPFALPQPVAAKSIFTTLQMLLAAMQDQDPIPQNMRSHHLVRVGHRVLRQLADQVAPETTGPLAQRLAQRYGCPADLIETTLILCAEHELNASSFTVRCVASTGASLYAALIAGLSALQGIRHGQALSPVDALIGQALETSAEMALYKTLENGSEIPGFGHPLYPNGDPRALFLLDHLPEGFLTPELKNVAQGLVGMAANGFHEKPNLDFALALIGRGLGEPIQAGTLLFALGRMAGWIAHAIEQYTDGRLIRPRARYIPN